ncbi:MAG: response regulator [Candidatus Krumholzibacteriia bacterium]
MPLPTSSPYRALFEHSSDAHLIIDGDHFVDCNQAAVEMLRCQDKQAVLQTHPSQLSPPTQPDGRPSFEKANEMMATALSTGNHRFEWIHQRADGEAFPVEVLLTAIPGPEGPRLYTVWRDISERKQLEADLRHAQKMDAVGRLAGGVAHDFNNLLVSILGHSELIESALAADSELCLYAQEIRRAGERAADLVSQLLAFSRKQVLRPAVVDVGPLLANLVRMLGRLLDENINLVTELPADELLVRADPAQLEQVVINLVTNARDAMPRGGRLTLLADHCRLDAGDPAAHALEPGEYALISVVDDGVGIPPDRLHRIFDPFFTTKGHGKGTGLGLAMVYGVVKQSGGDVIVHSELQGGSRFDIYLPRCRHRDAPPSSEPPRPRVEDGCGTILLVEDDADAGALMARVLRHGGYTVLEARDGMAALELLHVTPLDVIDLLVSDVVMPNIGGLELAQTLRQRRPDLPVLLATGYAEDAAIREHRGRDYDDLLQKPFSPTDLRARVRALLDARRDAFSP